MINKVYVNEENMNQLSEEKAQKFAKLIIEIRTLKKGARRRIRKRLLRIRDDVCLGTNHDATWDDGLKEHIENQFKTDIQQDWKHFTINWDIAPNDPFKVIIIEQWTQFGGEFDEWGNRYPTGFTKQEV